MPSIAVPALLVHLLGGCSGGEPTRDMGGNSAAATPDAPVANAAAPIPDGKLVLAFGDSLYAGYGVGPRESFPAQLQVALRAGGVPATVVNAGVSGDTTAGGRARLAYALDGLPRKPDLVLLGLGGNDMLRGLAPEEARANLTAMMDELKRRGVPVMLTGMIAAPNLGRDYGARFNAIYPDLAKAYGATLDPFFLDGVVTDPRLMQGDRVHPTAQGIARIVRRVAPTVEAALKGA